MVTCALGLYNITYAQQLFTEEGQAYAIMEGTPAFTRVDVDPSNGALRMATIAGDIGAQVDAIGYRRTDRMIYGVHHTDKQVYRVDAMGTLQPFGIFLDAAYEYKAGDISPDGRTYVVIASANQKDRQLLRIDLSTPGHPVSTLLLSGNSDILDVAFDPADPGVLYGYDAFNRTVVKINLVSLTLTGMTVLDPTHEIQSVYFTAFDKLIALGTYNGGVAGALFEVDKSTGQLKVITTGPVYRVVDLAGIPYSVEMENTPSARVAFPCDEIEYTFAVANRTDTVQSKVNFETAMPSGFTFKGLSANPLGGTASYNTGVLQIKGMTLPKGTGQFRFKVQIGDVSAGNHFLQGTLSNLPGRYGSKVVSDDPQTPQMEDSTHVLVNRIEEDSLRFARFLCLGDSMLLDGSPYGSQVHWSTGSSNLQITVTSGGQYTLHVVGGCQSTVVVFNVTEATCPFTMKVLHQMIPPETLPCSEVIFRFKLMNDTGVRREGLSFTDTLPAGMTFSGIESNPFGGQLDEAALPAVIHIEGMSVPLGSQSLDFRIAVGDIPPGEYRNQAVLRNLPSELGPFRYSDDPSTPILDSTPLHVLGVETDTLYVDEIICGGSTVVLDGAPYGVNQLWFDGTTDPTTSVTSPGTYQLTTFDGCAPTYIFFVVTSGEPVEVRFDSVVYHVHLGDSLLLQPQIFNSGNALSIDWLDPISDLPLCPGCPELRVYPLSNRNYIVYASNEECTDSAIARVLVDNTRKIFVPNIFTPNFDGVNDVVSVYSPDYGVIESFAIMDRWGSVLYAVHNVMINDVNAGWDGRVGGREAPEGTYIWNARIRFLDQRSEAFAGTVALIR